MQRAERGTGDRKLLEGFAFPSFEFRVETGKIREFAKATKSSNPAYFEMEPTVSPGTFLTTVLHWTTPATDPNQLFAAGLPWFIEHEGERVDVSWDSSLALHGEQEFEFFGPPPGAGTRLTGQTRVTEVFEKEGSRGGSLSFLKTVTEFRNEAGELTAEARCTCIETSRPPTTGAEQ